MNIVSEVRIVLGESAGGVFWTDSHILDALNEAQLDLASENKISVSTSTWIVEAGSDLVAIPSEIMIPKIVEDTSREFFVTTQAKLEQYHQGWRGAGAGIPNWFVLWDAFNIRVWPRPDNDYQYNLVGYPWPDELTISSDLTPDNYTLKKSLVYRTASVLLEATQPSLSDFLFQTALRYESDYKVGLRNAQSHNIIRLHPGPNRTNSGKSGVIKLGKGFTQYGL